MPYAMLDDNFHSHPKVLQLAADPDGAHAIALWTLALSWAHAHTRNKPPAEQGLVPVHVATALARMMGVDSARCAAALVAAELWDVAADSPGQCYRIHQFSSWQQLDQREARREAGRRGAEARWGSKGEPLPLDGMNPDDCHSGANATALRSDALPTPTPTYTKDQNTRTAAGAAEREFETFWAAYPRKIGKQAARRAWDKAVIKGRMAPEVITVGARRFARQCEVTHCEQRYIPHPSTWLNAGRWADEPEDQADGPREVSPW